MRKHPLLYAMAAPAAIWLIMFRILPNIGALIAFQNFNIYKGMWKSTWVGFDNFRTIFAYDDFYMIFTNTLIFGFLLTGFGWTVPILLALSINEVRSLRLKRSLQTVIYLPHFFSWVVISGLFFQFFGLNGVVNRVVEALGGEPVLFVQQRWFFRPMVVLASLFRDSGYGTIVYLASIAGIDPALYEAAQLDGAGRFRRIFSITLPSIMPTAIVLLLLGIGQFMQLGFDRVWNFLTPLTWSVGDVFDTYVYRVGITQGQYSLTTAIGLFQSVVGLVLVIGFDRMTKRLSGGLW